jgi:hypothetical protein
LVPASLLAGTARSIGVARLAGGGYLARAAFPRPFVWCCLVFVIVLAS